MTVARETKVKGQAGEITRLRNLDEGTSKTELRNIPLKRESFEAAENMREVGR